MARRKKPRADYETPISGLNCVRCGRDFNVVGALYAGEDVRDGFMCADCCRATTLPFFIAPLVGIVAAFIVALLLFG